ncbi:hypothetical protein PR048_010489 [Dryococelus australis]|uniref:Uncharacterized protein n=1 Tax=Dryococelus australis TaxID=614101 RepID=A0ABQ9I3Z5_9NEOP|nr:hypothetical protein PR048_010489 [Dryococelus australis]
MDDYTRGTTHRIRAHSVVTLRSSPQTVTFRCHRQLIHSCRRRRRRRVKHVRLLIPVERLKVRVLGSLRERSTCHEIDMGAAVSKRLTCSPPTKVNRVQSPARSLPDFSQVRITPHDAAGRRVFSGIFRPPFDLICSIRTSFHPHRLPRPQPMKVKRGEYGETPVCEGGGNERKSAGQGHSPARFPRTKIRERPHPLIEPCSPRFGDDFNPRPDHSGFSHVGIVPDDAVGRGFSRGLPFPPPVHSGTAPFSHQSSSSALKTPRLRAAKITRTLTITTRMHPCSSRPAQLLADSRLARKHLANPITARCEATANEHTAEAAVCGRLRSLALRVIERAKFSYPYRRKIRASATATRNLVAWWILAAENERCSALSLVPRARVVFSQLRARVIVLAGSNHSPSCRRAVSHCPTRQRAPLYPSPHKLHKPLSSLLEEFSRALTTLTIIVQWGHGGVVVRLLASRGVAPGIFVPADVAGRRVFLGDLSFPAALACIPALLNTKLDPPLKARRCVTCLPDLFSPLQWCGVGQCWVHAHKTGNLSASSLARGAANIFVYVSSRVQA